MKVHISEPCLKIYVSSRNKWVCHRRGTEIQKYLKRDIISYRFNSNLIESIFFNG